MKSGAGARKGGAFERLVCKRLSFWLSQGERDDLFWRSSLSGGRATLQLRREFVNMAQAGDLTAISREAYEFAEHLFIECKHIRDLGFGRGFICQTGVLWNFWQKACESAQRYNKTPVLIARQNLYPIVVVTTSIQAVFRYPAQIILPGWNAEVCQFEPATAYRRLIRRRGNLDDRQRALVPSGPASEPVGQPIPRAPRPVLIRHVRDEVGNG
jgi:hypothetical protein